MDDDDPIDDVYKEPTTTAQIATMMFVLFITVMVLSVLVFSGNVGDFLGRYVTKTTFIPIIQGAIVGLSGVVVVGCYKACL